MRFHVLSFLLVTSTVTYGFTFTPYSRRTTRVVAQPLYSQKNLNLATSTKRGGNRREWLGKTAYGALLPVISIWGVEARAEDGSAASISDDLSMPESAPLSEAEQKAQEAARLAKKAALQKKSARPLDYGESVKAEKEKQADMKKIVNFMALLLPALLLQVFRPSVAVAATVSAGLPLRKILFPLLVSALTGMFLTALADTIVQVSGNDISTDAELYKCSYLMSLTELTKGERWKLFITSLKDRGRAVNLPRLSSFALFGLCLKGIFQFFLYSFWIPRLSGGSLVRSVALDSFGYVPLVYYPFYFMLTGKIQYKRGFLESLNVYRKDIVRLCSASFLFWVPIQIVNFSFTPNVWRNLVVLLSAFVWTIVLSILTQK